ncbi:MAG: hypothetical protein NTW14_09835 [bacterium]|nr:hypothetical protein [bacterium]
MTAKNLTIQMMLVALLSLGLLLTGCTKVEEISSETGNSSLVAPTDDLNQETPPLEITHYQYPEAANNPPPGYQFIHLTTPDPVRVIDDPPQFVGPNYIYKFINKSQGGSVWLSKGAPIPANPTFSGVVFSPWGLPYSTWIGIYQPDLDEPWVEYEPHGIYFNGAQHGHINFSDCDLQNVEPEDLTIWYWNEQLNEYEYIGGTVNLAQEYIEFNLYHFSRYVVASSL